jgi:putative endonuclease
MLDQNCLVFVEVRYRSHGALASAIATVDRRKQQKLIRTAEMFLATRPRHSSCIARFDVVAIDSLGNGSTTIDWIRDAFRP